MRKLETKSKIKQVQMLENINQKLKINLHRMVYLTELGCSK